MAPVKVDVRGKFVLEYLVESNHMVLVSPLNDCVVQPDASVAVQFNSNDLFLSGLAVLPDFEVEGVEVHLDVFELERLAFLHDDFILDQVVVPIEVHQAAFALADRIGPLSGGVVLPRRIVIDYKELLNWVIARAISVHDLADLLYLVGVRLGEVVQPRKVNLVVRCLAAHNDEGVVSLAAFLIQVLENHESVVPNRPQLDCLDLFLAFNELVVRLILAETASIQNVDPI